MTSDDKSPATGTANNIDLYSLLNVHRDATVDDIHRAYKRLSTTFHPDKLPRDTSEATKDKIQQVFLEFKLASESIVFDAVLDGILSSSVPWHLSFRHMSTLTTLFVASYFFYFIFR